MNQDTSPNAANNPAPAALGSTLRVAVPLLALVGVVFGITFFAQYTPPKDGDEKNNPDLTKRSVVEPPLRFFTSRRVWDPPKLSAAGYRYLPLLAPSSISADPESATKITFSLQDRIFQWYYEASGEESAPRRTQFWFENRNSSTVTMQLKGVSCTACSGARLAAIPPETTKNLFQHTALAALPIGVFHGFGVGLVEPAADLTRLEWTQAQFRDDPNVQFHVPAATNPDKWSPQWGILEITFRVRPNPTLPLTADFATQVDGTTRAGNQHFELYFQPSDSCELSQSAIDAKIIEPLSNDREYKLYVYSNTRGPGSEFGDLDPPSFLVQAPAGITDPVKFIEVTKVERVPDAELVDLIERFERDQNRPSKIRAAYQITVTLRPKVGEHRLDIGQMERTISVTCGTAQEKPQQLQVKAIVRGAVRLDNDATEIDLKTFRGAAGTEESVNLTTEKSGIELAVVKDECRPANFGFELVKQPDSGGQGHYRLKITVEKGKVFGQVKGVVVLEVKGPTPQRIRLPFKGNSSL